MRELLRRLRREALPRDVPGFWFSWAATAAALGYEDLKMEAALLTKEGVLNAFDFGLVDFDEVVALARSDPAGLAAFHDQKVLPLDDAIGALEAWVFGDDDGDGVDEDEAGREDNAVPEDNAGPEHNAGSVRQSIPQRRPQRPVSMRQRQEIQEVLHGRMSGARAA